MVSKFIVLRSSSLRAARIASGIVLLIVAISGAALANGGGGGGGGGGGAPEIDAGSAMSALTLLTGGILLITDRIRRGKSSG